MKLVLEEGAGEGRVADLCPIHATLRRATEVDRRVVALPADGAE